MKSVKALLYFSLFTFHFSLCFGQVDGIMYSMTYGGGDTLNPIGVINRYNPITNDDTAVVAFDGSNGKESYANFIQLPNGILCGFSAYGGIGYGNIFEYNTLTGKDSVVYNIPNADSAEFMYYGPLLHATNDLLYGLAFEGGTAYGSGVLFSFNYHNGNYQVCAQMRGATTGYFPASMPIQGKDSLLYCTAWYVNSGYGSLFTYNIYTTDVIHDTVLLYKFLGAPNDGNEPSGRLFQAGNGIMYGTTIYGGTTNQGTLFSWNIQSKTETVLANFTGVNGALPYNGVMQANDSNLYGLTYSGGMYNQGVIYRYNIHTNTETVLHNFKGAPTDGSAPADIMIQATDGLLYGTTDSGGTYNQGTIFSFNIGTNTETVLVNYNGTLGNQPYGDLLEVMSVSSVVYNDICTYDSNGAIKINIRGGKSPFTFVWSNGASADSASHLKTGIYTCTVTDSRGVEWTVIDTVKPLPMVFSFAVSNPCIGSSMDSTIVSVSGGIAPFTYSWSNGTTNDTLRNVPPGTYTLTITDAHGCKADSNFTIKQADSLKIDSVVIITAWCSWCTTGSIRVYVSGGIPPGDSVYYYYLWSNGGSDSSTLADLTPDTFAVCVTSPYYDCGSVCDTNLIVYAGIPNINNLANNVHVFPVPSTGPETVILNGTGFEELEIDDIFGREVYAQTLDQHTPDYSIPIDLSKEPDGVYLLHLKATKGTLTEKLLIQK